MCRRFSVCLQIEESAQVRTGASTCASFVSLRCGLLISMCMSYIAVAVYPTTGMSRLTATMWVSNLRLPR